MTTPQEFITNLSTFNPKKLHKFIQDAKTIPNFSVLVHEAGFDDCYFPKMMIQILYRGIVAEPPIFSETEAATLVSVLPDIPKFIRCPVEGRIENLLSTVSLIADTCLKRFSFQPQ